jgi:hypothetical protein
MLDAEQKMKLLISDRPWEHEPNIEEWTHELTGYKCTVMRHQSLGHLNGYVAIPKEHRVWGKGYDDVQLEVGVHGGLTYSGEDKETGEWVFGFDCSHGGDFSPKLVATLLTYTDTDISHHMRDTYRTFAWVKAEVHSLARQLKMLDMKPNGETK